MHFLKDPYLNFVAVIVDEEWLAADVEPPSAAMFAATGLPTPLLEPGPVLWAACKNHLVLISPMSAQTKIHWNTPCKHSEHMEWSGVGSEVKNTVYCPFKNLSSNPYFHYFSPVVVMYQYHLYCSRWSPSLLRPHQHLNGQSCLTSAWRTGSISV